MKRREFLKTVGVATASAALPRRLGAAQPDTSRPNVLFVLADDMGVGDLSYLNPDSQIPTPNLDRVGREGTYFTDAHSPSALCTPTRYGILTGRYCWRTRVKRGVLWGYSRHLIEADRMTVPSLLQRHGYNTAHIGKWHLGMDMPTTDGQGTRLPHTEADQRAYTADVDWTGRIENGPTSIGFDHFYGISASLDMHPYIYIDDDRFVGAATSTQDLLFVTRDYRPARYADNTGPAHPEFVAEEVLPVITRRSVAYVEQQSVDTPFFLCMSLTAPHIPIVPSAPFVGRSRLGAYGDFCIEVDESVGQVLDALDRRGLAENTLVIFAADNGCAPYIGVEEMNELGHFPSHIYRGYKSDIWEGGHRVPFLARWPARIAAGSSSDETVCLTDLLATCASILGDELPSEAGEDSYDILPALVGDTYNRPIREATIHHAGDGSFSIRQGRWKLELTPSSGGYGNLDDEEVRQRNLPPIQLYDLQADIAETRNVYDRYPEVVARLTALLESYQEQGRSTPL